MTKSRYRREAVGIFQESEAFRSSIRELRRAGFAPSDLSFMLSGQAVEDKLHDCYGALKQSKGEAALNSIAYKARPGAELAEAEVAPELLYLGDLPQAQPLVASGGSFAAAVAQARASISRDGLLCAPLDAYIEKRHLISMTEQLTHGALLLWVHTASEEAERNAVTLLRQQGAQEVEVHSLPKQGEQAADVPEAEVKAFDVVEEASRESFPASDPPSYTMGRRRKR